MAEKSSPDLAAADARVPEIFEGIQVNHCRRPTCRNFGVDPVNGPRRRGGSKRTADPNYRLVDVKIEKSLRVPGLKCRLCGDNPPLKSNRGIHEEYARAGAHFRVWLAAKASPSGPTATCGNHGRGVAEHPGLYWRFGTTPHGSIRWRCKACKRTFVQPTTSLHRQKKSHENKLIFQLLMNKVPMNRILEVTGVSSSTLYGKIDFLHRQAQMFAAAREAALFTKPFRRLYLSTDRQDYLVNGKKRDGKRAIQLTAIGTCDNRSSYVFTFTLNFDGSLDRNRVAAHAEAIGDTNQPPARRERYARFWLAGDYEADKKRAAAEINKGIRPAG